MVDKLGPYDLNTIVTGDARELAEAIPDESVDLVFTDPPYHDEYLYCWDILGEIALRVLKQNSVLISYAGKMFLPDIIKTLDKYLDYWWMFSLTFTFGGQRTWSKKIFGAWRPLIVYAKGNPNFPWMPDARFGNHKDKRFHDWGQEEFTTAFYCEKLSNIGDIILDPFAGGGDYVSLC